MVIVVPLFEFFSTLVLLFTSCELPGRVSTEFQNISDLINEFEWYLFSLEMKKMLPIIMANAQEPVDFKCFGNFACNRETFKKVRLENGIKI